MTSNTAEIRIGGEVKTVQLTSDFCDVLSDQGIDHPKSAKKLTERVKELLYDLIEIRPRPSENRTEVIVTDHQGNVSFDVGQMTKIDHADDVEIRMIRETGMYIGWSEQ